MIEWIPIRDYAFTVDEEFLVLIKSSSGSQLEASVAKYMKQHYIITQRFNLTFSSASLINPFWASQRGNIGTYQITHAAPLNFPKEKTLEEKFEASVRANRQLLLPKAVYEILAEIAKEHYEGKE